jgi:hypothetical protein
VRHHHFSDVQHVSLEEAALVGDGRAADLEALDDTMNALARQDTAGSCARSIAPIDGPKPVPESAWIAIAEVGPGDWADGSPDGKTLYDTSRKMEMTACGGSGSEPVPIGLWARPLQCNLQTKSQALLPW